MQALAYQWLGRWYEDIDQDFKQAQHCYERAVTLDDDDIIAGTLCLRGCICDAQAWHVTRCLKGCDSGMQYSDYFNTATVEHLVVRYLSLHCVSMPFYALIYAAKFCKGLLVLMISGLIFFLLMQLRLWKS